MVRGNLGYYPSISLVGGCGWGRGGVKEVTGLDRHIGRDLLITTQ